MLLNVQDSHWWYRARLRELRAWCAALPPGSRILDIGSAVGGHTRALAALGFDVEGLEYSSWAVEYQRAIGLRVTEGDARRLPWPDASFDAAICLDVLEHIEEDAMVVAEIRRILKPGGRFLVSVPEDHRLWSEHDVAVGHVRRYSRTDAVNCVKSVGLLPDSVWSTNVLLKPIARVRRLFSKGSDLKQTSGLENAVGLAAATLERWLGLRHRSGMTVWISGHAPTTR